LRRPLPSSPASEVEASVPVHAHCIANLFSNRGFVLEMAEYADANDEPPATPIKKPLLLAPCGVAR
jgi:hypothetical protein